MTPIKKNNMSNKHKKQFGVWMDSKNATIVGRKDNESDDFTILGHVKGIELTGNSNENAAHNQEIAATHKYFKEIVQTMPNIDEIHVTGTGQIQEQFIKFLSETPQFKNAKSTESTSTKMSNDQLIDLVTKYFH